MKYFLVNHFRRTYVETKITDIIDDYNFMTKYYSFHNGLQWNEIELIESVDEVDFNKVLKMWKENKIDTLIDYYKTKFKRYWCCQTDGYHDSMCCDEHFFLEKISKMVEAIEYFKDKDVEDMRESFELYGDYWKPLKIYYIRNVGKKCDKNNLVDFIILPKKIDDEEPKIV